MSELMNDSIPIARVVFVQKTLAPRKAGVQGTAPVSALDDRDHVLSLTPGGVLAWRKDSPGEVRLYGRAIVAYVDFPQAQKKK